MIRRTYPLELTGELGPRQVRVRASTANIGRDGMIVHPAGIDLTSYRKNPVMLWQHDPAAPVARATMLGMEGPDLCADVEFAPEGISAKADEICGLVKAGIVNAVSIGFDPLETEPLDAKRPHGGQRVLRSELMEISFVSVPADREAVVLQRKDALKGFSTPEQIREDEIDKDGPPSARAAAPVMRGMCQVAQLAYLVDSLCSLKCSVEIESALEGDDSKVVGMLARTLQDAGAALIAMSEEEVAELLAGTEEDPDDGADLDEPDMVVVMQSAIPAVRQFRIGYLRTKAAIERAGKKLSAESMRSMRAAMDHHDEAMELHRAAMRAHTRATQVIGDMLDGQTDGNKQIQKSDGVAEDEGSRAALDSSLGVAAADWRHRQVDLLALQGVALSRQ